MFDEKHREIIDKLFTEILAYCNNALAPKLSGSVFVKLAIGRFMQKNGDSSEDIKLIQKYVKQWGDTVFSPELIFYSENLNLKNLKKQAAIILNLREISNELDEIFKET